MSKNQLMTLRDSDFYKQLIDNIKAAVITKRTEANMSIIEMKWWIGKEIIDAQPDFERFGYGQNVIGILSKDLGISASNLYQCMSFYKKFQAKEFDEIVMKLPEGNNITWYKITQEYLPEDSREKSPMHFISCKVDDSCKVIYVKEKYQDYKIKYY